MIDIPAQGTTAPARSNARRASWLRASWLRAGWLRAGWLMAGLTALAGCASFAGEDSVDVIQENTCSSDADCAVGSWCRQTICVARSASEQDITLHITPAFLPDGSAPLPIEEVLSRVDAPRNPPDFNLPPTVPTDVIVERDGLSLAAEVRLRPANLLPGMPAPSLTVGTLEGTHNAQVSLAESRDYMVRAEPVDPSLPPVTQQVTAEAGVPIRFDYDAEFTTREYQILGVEDDQVLSVQAVEPESGRRISSIAMLEDGFATLVFPDPEAAYRLEISTPTRPEVPSPATGCGIGLAPPSYQISSHALPDEEPIKVGLPSLLAPIDYAGTVELCGNGEALVSATDVDSLQVSLRSTELLTGDGEPSSSSVATAVFRTETSATVDERSGKLQFCARALPGQYDVVVNPPRVTGNCERSEDAVRCGCGIFAESRLIRAPSDRTEQVGVTLTLPTMASISGVLSTEAGLAVSEATIDAVARRTDSALELAEGDRGITTYNRSRQGTSDEQGGFRVPLDVGVYDITIKPPAESGFAWQLIRDVRISSRTQEFSSALTMDAPIAINGVLRYPDGNDLDQTSLAGATIRAFNVVEELDVEGRRAVQVGQATADETGNFMLLVSPRQRKEAW